MATESSRRLLTYEDYAALPDDGKKYELIAGELILCPSASRRHQRLIMLVVGAFLEFEKAHPIGYGLFDFDVNPAPHDTVRPDLMFFLDSRPGIATDRKATEVPDLVGEVLSSNYPYDLREKKQIYARYGAKEYWAFHQDRPRVLVFRLEGPGRFGPPAELGEGDVLTTPLLPGFSLPISDLYQDLPA